MREISGPQYLMGIEDSKKTRTLRPREANVETWHASLEFRVEYKKQQTLLQLLCVAKCRRAFSKQIAGINSLRWSFQILDFVWSDYSEEQWPFNDPGTKSRFFTSPRRKNFRIYFPLNLERLEKAMQYWAALFCSPEKHPLVLYSLVPRKKNVIFSSQCPRSLWFSAGTRNLFALHYT